MNSFIKKSALMLGIIGVISCSHIEARNFNFEPNIGISTMAGSEQFKTSSGGTKIGANFNYFMNRRISVSTGFSYTSETMKTGDIFAYSSSYTTTETLERSYVEIPLVLRGHLYVGKKSHFNLGAGAYYTLGTTTKYKITAFGTNSDTSKDSGYDESDLGLLLQAGYNISTFKNNHLTLNLEYRIGLTEHKPSAALLAVNTTAKTDKYSGINFRIGHTF